MVDETNDNSSAVTGLKNKGQVIKLVDIDKALGMLDMHMDSQHIAPLLAALEALKTDPQSEALQLQVVAAFNGLGIYQGAVLTYAPYLNVFLSDDPFGDS